MRFFTLLSGVAFMLATFGATAYAQQGGGNNDNLGEITFEELKDKESGSNYFAAGGGFVGQFALLNTNKINDALKTYGVPGFATGSFSSPLFLSGGEGFVAVNLIKNLRVGFTGMAGTQTVTKDTLGSKSNTDLTLSLNGLNIDYAIPVFRGFTILPGLQTGWGMLRIENYGGRDTSSWTTGSDIPMKRIEASHIYVQPHLNLEYSLTKLTMLRLSASYNATFMGTWRENRTSTISGVPSDLTGNGLAIGFGVFVGLFNND
ncbi:MAG: hypothetical protein JNL32_05260 [Candidatus Kapabacteria bacterium]|nr:hypothetical protein [Candidatus Kapabacteria bacterium]